MPTPGLSDVSGVRDETACGAVGKLMVSLLYGDPHNVSIKTLTMLGKLRNLPRNAKIYLEHTGKGYPFYRAKYRRINPKTGRSEVVAVYLGRPDNEILRWAQAILLEERLIPGSRSFTDPRTPKESPN